MTRPSLCIVNWNGERHLRRSLPAAERLRESFCEILVVDNGSTDGSLDYLRRHHPEVRVARLPENRGAGAARNLGIAEARSDRILFIDNDVELLPGCPEALSTALDARKDAIAAQATVLYRERPEIIQYAGAGAHYLGLMVLEHADRPVTEAGTRIRTNNSLVTCCFMLDRARLDADLRFEESYFYINEDHDFGLQIRLRGGVILAVPDARVLHGEGAEGVSIRQLGRYSRTRVHYTIRNRWLLLARIHATRTLILTLPAHLLFELGQLAVALRRGWFAEWRGAVAWMVAQRRTILEQRRRLQACRKLGDGAFLAGGAPPFRAELASSGFERMVRGALDRFFAGYWPLVRPFVDRQRATNGPVQPEPEAR